MPDRLRFARQSSCLGGARLGALERISTKKPNKLSSFHGSVGASQCFSGRLSPRIPFRDEWPRLAFLRNVNRAQGTAKLRPNTVTILGFGVRLADAPPRAISASTESVRRSPTRFRRALSLALVLQALAGCAGVIELDNGYYLAPDKVGSAGVSGVGAGGGSAGSGGASDSSPCGEHPITAKSTWVANASSQYDTNPPSSLIDNSTARWSSGKPQSGDEWLQIDFGAPVSIRSINLQQGADRNDYPRMYAIFISDTDTDLTGAVRASGVGSSGDSTTSVLTHSLLGRYLLIKQLGMSLSWWSVEELEVSCFDD
jgi:hypothetical protein